MTYTVKEVKDPPRYRMRCCECGGTDLEFRAFAYWSEERQEFVFDDLDQDYEPWCRDCQDNVGYDEEVIRGT